ncbi:MAG: hypothetical protein WC385_01640, partial [Candidatus Paceibacterota bacterium]
RRGFPCHTAERSFAVTTTIVSLLAIAVFRRCWTGLVVIVWSSSLLLVGSWERLHGRKIEWPE